MSRQYVHYFGIWSLFLIHVTNIISGDIYVIIAVIITIVVVIIMTR